MLPSACSYPIKELVGIGWVAKVSNSVPEPPRKFFVESLEKCYSTPPLGVRVAENDVFIER
jgi:hypothetical protein